MYGGRFNYNRPPRSRGCTMPATEQATRRAGHPFGLPGGISTESFSHHGNLDPKLSGAVYGFFIARVDVAHDSRAGVVGEDAREPFCRLRRAVGHDDLPGVQGVADADAAAV